MNPVAILDAVLRRDPAATVIAYGSATEGVVAYGALASLTLRAGSIELTHGDSRIVLDAGADPIGALGKALHAHVPAPWRAYGYLAFDVAGAYFPYDKTRSAALARLFVPRSTIRIDAGGVKVEGEDDGLLQDVRSFEEPAAENVAELATTGKERYLEHVRAVLAQLRPGELDKVIVARQALLPGRLALAPTYAEVRKNRAARTFAFQLDDVRGAGSPPEMLLLADDAGRVITNPLAGTKPRGTTPEEDERLRRDLLADPKEVREHAISAKLAYDEMAAVCTPETLALVEFMQVKLYPFTQHLSSRATGVLAPAKTPWDALRAVFPAVTVSGIPKERAVREITTHEDFARGIYGGTVGFADSNGTMDWSIAIRCAFDYGEGVSLNAGAGLVSDSNAEDEYIESLNKMRTMAARVRTT